jgi:hypothetical protein
MLKKMVGHFTLPLLLLVGICWESSDAQSPGKKPATAATGEALSLNAKSAKPRGAGETFAPGPDVIAGNMADLGGYGFVGFPPTQIGLAMGITSCNAGNAEVSFMPLPNVNHPAVAQNFYRMSGGASNSDRFEQIAQSWVKHTYGAKQANDCNFGCTPAADFVHLGVGCSDTYFASQSADANDLGSRAWINPFTGVFPSTAEDHTGHNHTNTSHLMVPAVVDLDPSANSGATYYAELLYVTPDEYAWCQAHAGQCNMFNNASYHQYNISGSGTNLNITPVGETIRMIPALQAWTGATIHSIEPEPGVDGRAVIGYKVTGPDAGVWHYEYALYNQNLDRGIQSFSVPLGCGVGVNNLGFHGPLNDRGWPHDGTLGDAGFSNAPWTANQTASALSWSTETFAQNQNANAVRWGTLYNFRFDSDRPPQAMNATIGFFKTGTPITVGIQGPTGCNATPTPTPTPSPTPPGTAQAINLSTRMRVQTGDNVGIGGFIVSGSAPKHVLLRAMGPSLAQSGIPNPLADPTLELHGPGAFVTITNDNWRDDPAQEAAILATGIAPSNNLESAIDATLAPGNYTAVVKGKNNTLGVALVEVYDLNAAALSKLANMSTRAFVSTGDNVVIAGITLGSHRDNDRIVVRGMGPSLTAAGVPNALADPTLELRDSNGALLSSNNDWQDNAAQAMELTAAGLAPTNNLESGLATTLPAGLYTALLAGLNNGAGIGLVEVYDRGSP